LRGTGGQTVKLTREGFAQFPETLPSLSETALPFGFPCWIGLKNPIRVRARVRVRVRVRVRARARARASARA